MAKDLLKNHNLVSVSEAAQVLGVSIDTIRRWDKVGRLHSQRPNNKDRFFSLEELEKEKFGKGLSISEAAEKLGISQSTLRRLDKKGIITPQRNDIGERVYTLKSVHDFLESEYFLRTKEVEDQVLEPIKDPLKQITKQSTYSRVTGKIVTETQAQVNKLRAFRNLVFTSAGFAIISTALIIVGMTVMFLLFPEDTARFLGFQAKVQPRPATKLGSAQVLGVSTSEQSQVVGTLLKPFSNLSLTIVKRISPKAYNRAVPPQIVDADFVQGRQPGIFEGDLAVVGKNGTIEGLLLQGLTPSAGLTLTDSCSSDQILSWDGIDWVCSDQTGAISSLNSLTGALKIAASGIATISTSGSTITITASEADTLSSVVGRGATTTTAVTFGQLDTTGNVGLGKSLTVTGLTLANGGLNVTGLSNLTGNVGIGKSLTVTSAGVFSSGITVSGHSSLSTIAASGLTTLNGGLALNLGSDATGDVLYRNSGGTISRLGIGSAGQALVVSSGLPSWGTGSQWTTSSNNIYVIGATGAGNVGIGNTYANYAKLQLTGSGTGTGLTFLTTDSSGAQRFSILDNGNVGIGTTGPAYQFQVGSSAVTPGLIVTSSGNVGIGVTNPSAYLQVNGNALITNALVSGTAGTATQITTGDPSTKGLIIKGTSGSGSSFPSNLSSWSYRRSVSITNSSGSTLTNFQVSITLDTSSLISAKMQSDCDDIRVTDSDGTTLLSHWIETGTNACNTTTTAIWTKVPSIPTSGTTLYIYYGNTSASSGQDGSNAFIYFDDFSTNTSSNYTVTTGSVSIASGILTLTGVDASNAVIAPTTQTNPSSYIVEARAAYTDRGAAPDSLVGVSGFQSAVASSNTGYIAQYGIVTTSRVGIEDFTVAHLVTSSITHTAGTYYLVKGTFVSGSPKATFQRTTDASVSNSKYTSGSYGLRTYDANGTYDFWFVRAYAATEPSVASPGTEEAGGGGQTANLTEWQNSSGTVLSVVNSSGNIGIGFSSPAATLDVIGSSLLRGTGGTWGLAVTSSGLVGIGVTNPLATLSVNGSGLFGYSGTASAPSNGLGIQGNVGVGTTSPIQALHVVGQCVTGDTKLRRRRRKGTGDRLQGTDEDWEDVRIDQIQPGDEILTLDETSGEFVYQKVNNLMDMGIQKTYQLITESGKSIRTTANHPYLVRETQLAARGLFEESNIGQKPSNQEQSITNTKLYSEIGKINHSWLPLFLNLNAKDIDTILNPKVYVNNTSFADISFSGVNGVAMASANQPAARLTNNSDNIADKAGSNLINNNLSQGGNWVKVSQLRVGMEVATTSGWEKITYIKEYTREQVFDIEIENTHNFVGNNIVAHNTYISGNLGIGFTTPINPLVVSGAGTIGLGYNSYTAPSNGLLVQGNVGIGTSAPQGVLDVNGTSFFRGVVTTTGNVGVGGSITGFGALNGLNVTGLSNLAALNATGATTLGSTLAVTGVASFADGSAAAPGITFGLDTDTGIFRPSTNALGLSTGGTSRLTITAAGSIGIGITSPLGLFQVGSSAATPGLIVTSAGNVGIGVTNPSAYLQVNGNALITNALVSGTAGSATQITTGDPSTKGLIIKGNTNTTVVFPSNLSSWSYRRKITFDNSSQAENLTNFPVLVKLSSSNINYSNTQNSGQDIRVTDSDGTTLLSYEIEKWDETGSSLVWVKVPQVDASSSTDTIYMYYGNTSATDAQAATSVWDSNFKGVWHLPNGTTLTANDSTSNANNGTITGATAATGQINGAGSFDGTDDSAVSASNIGISGAASRTVAMWVKPTALNDSNITNPLLWWGAQSTNLLSMIGLGTRKVSVYGHSADAVGTTTLSNNTWYHVAFTYDGTNIRIYLNGILESTTALTWNTTNSVVTFGYYSGWPAYFNGQMDEVKISNSARSAAYIAASYKTENDTFNTFASEEAAGGTAQSANLQEWQNSSGTVLSVVTSGGNIGIGFSSPAATLDVIGSSLLRGTGGIYGLAVTSSGLVGIGVTNPLATFAVNGSSLFGYSGTASAPSNGLGIQGNVGVGTTTANNPLSVVGAASFGTYSQLTAPANGLIVSGNTGIGTSSPQGVLDVNGTSFFRGVVTTTGNVGVGASLTTTGLGVFNGGLNVSGLSNLTGALNVGGVTNFTSAAQLADGTASAPGLNFTSDTNSGLYRFASDGIALVTGGLGSQTLSLNSSGNVGVGTTSPLQALHVVGQCVTGDTRLRRRKRKKMDDGRWIDEYDEVRIDEINPGDEILTLDEYSGEFVYQKVNALMEMGIQTTFELITESGKSIRTTSNHPYLVKGELLLSTPGHYGGESHQDKGQKYYSQNQINQQSISHFIHLLNHTLKAQNPIVADSPNITSRGLNLSRTAGSTTEAKATKATSDDISDNFSIWESFNLSSINPTLSDTKLPVNQGEKWIKVSQIKAGMEVATIDGWEKIVAIKQHSREQVFDIEVENTHNFVGNNIVAHNTYISGNLGIGITTPGAGLSLSSNAVIGYTGVNIAGPSSGLAVSGNVGVGTTTANNPLSVVGAASFGTYSQLTAPSNGLIVSGNTGIGTSAPQGVLDVNGISFFRGVVTTSGGVVSINASSNFATNINTGTSTGAVSIGNSSAGALALASGAASSFTVTNANLTLSTTGASGANGRVIINSALASGNTTTEALSLKTTTDLGASDEVFQVGDSAADFLTIRGDGNVGIGTVGPSQKLHIPANSGEGIRIGNFQILRRVDQAHHMLIQTTASSAVSVLSVAPLGTGEANDYSSFEFFGTDFQADSTNYERLAFTAQQSQPNKIFSNAAGTGTRQPLAFCADQSGWNPSTCNQVYLTTGGNIGIGTTSPLSLLSVVGSAHIGGIRQGISAPSNGLFVDGNVGIGATTSSNLLDVWGNSRITGTLGVDSTGTLGSGLIGFPSTAVAPASGLGVSGNVGVGTTSPIQALHVVGQCVTGDTKLKRRKRNKKGEWTDEYEDIEIKDIQPGDEILSLDEKTGKFIPSIVEKLMDMGNQQTFALVTQHGKMIETTSNHPYLVLETKIKQSQKETASSTKFEVDQSGRVEDRGVSTVLAIANYQNSFIAKLERQEKQIIFKEYQERGKPKLLGPEIFALMIVKTIRESKARVTQLKIDTEYPGYDKLIAETIEKFYPEIILSIKPVGKHSPAHLAALPKQVKKNLKRAKKEEVVAGSKLKGFPATELLHFEFTKIRNPHYLLLDKKYTKEWVKVKYLKPGMIIATTDGWEKISNIYPTGRKATFDVQIKDTHNFVGNDIVAHNTYISGNVGIGFISPDSLLHLRNTGSGTTLRIEDAADDSSPFLIDAAGNVGIGMTSPAFPLEVQGGTGAGGIADLISIKHSNTSTSGDGPALRFNGFYSGAEWQFGRIAVINNGANFGTAMLFYTKPADNVQGGAMAEVWRMTPAGVLQSNGAQTVQTSTGDLTLATAGGNGDIVLSPNGTGNIGIGVAAPTDFIDTRRDQNAQTAFRIMNANTGTGAYAQIIVANSTGGSDVGGFQALGTGFTSSGMSLQDSINVFASTGMSNGMGLFTQASDTTAALRFGTQSTERMRIDTNGNVGIGTATPGSVLSVIGNVGIGTSAAGARLQVNGGGLFGWGTASVAAPSSGLAVSGNVGIGTTSPSAPLEVRGSGTGATIAKFTDENTTGCTLATGGTISCSSDINLKKNIDGLSFGLSDLMKLRPVEFNWKTENDSFLKNLGFIAQEVEIVIPKLVTTGLDGLKELNTIGLVPILTRAIQQQQVQIASQSATLSLQGQVLEGLTIAGETLDKLDKITADQIKEQIASNSAGPASASARLTSKFDTSSEDSIKLLTSLQVEKGVEVLLDMKVLGKLQALGGLVIEGPAQFKGDTIFQALAEFIGNVIFKGDISFEGRPTFNKDTAGFALVKKDADKVEVTFEKEYAETPLMNISITLDTLVDEKAASAEQLLQEASQSALEKQVLEEDIRYIVTRRTTKGFTIKINKPSATDLKFSWSALAVKDAKTVRSSESVVSSLQVETTSEKGLPVPSVAEGDSFEVDTLGASASAVVKPLTIKINDNELGYLRVREEATTASEEVGQVLPGQTFQVLVEKFGWYEIEYKTDFYGWVKSSYVTASS